MELRLGQNNNDYNDVFFRESEEFVLISGLTFLVASVDWES